MTRLPPFTIPFTFSLALLAPAFARAETQELTFEHDVRHILKAPISQYISSAILTQIRIERDGYPINRSAVKECVDVLLLLRVEDGAGSSVYKRDLEPAILKESEAFYKGEGERLLESCDAPEYLQRVSISNIFLRKC